MNRLRVLLVLVAGWCAAPALLAQEPPRGPDRPPRGGPPGVRPHNPEGRPDARGPESRPGPAAERRDRLWRAVVEAMSKEERRRFLDLPIREKERVVREAVAARSRAEEAAFLAELTDAQRAELEALADRPEARRRRFLELRVDRHFARAAEEAKARGVADDAELAQLRAAPIKARARATLDLQKRTFLAAHREDLATAPRRERDRLERVPADQFFDDPFVQDFKSFRFLSPAEVAKFRAVSPEAAGAFARGLIKGEVDDAAAAAAFSPERVAALKKLTPDERKRVGRDLRRLVIGGGRGGFLPPASLMDELTDEEARAMMRLPGPERRLFVLKKFGLQRVAEARREELQLRFGPKLAELLQRLSAEDRERLSALQDEPLFEELRRRFPEELPSLEEAQRARQPGGPPGGGPPGGGPPGGGRPGGRRGPPPGGPASRPESRPRRGQ